MRAVTVPLKIMAYPSFSAINTFIHRQQNFRVDQTRSIVTPQEAQMLELLNTSNGNISPGKTQFGPWIVVFARRKQYVTFSSV